MKKMILLLFSCYIFNPCFALKSKHVFVFQGVSWGMDEQEVIKITGKLKLQKPKESFENAMDEQEVIKNIGKFELQDFKESFENAIVYEKIDIISKIPCKINFVFSHPLGDIYSFLLVAIKIDFQSLNSSGEAGEDDSYFKQIRNVLIKKYGKPQKDNSTIERPLMYPGRIFRELHPEILVYWDTLETEISLISDPDPSQYFSVIYRKGKTKEEKANLERIKKEYPAIKL